MPQGTKVKPSKRFGGRRGASHKALVILRSTTPRTRWIHISLQKPHKELDRILRSNADSEVDGFQEKRRALNNINTAM